MMKNTKKNTGIRNVYRTNLARVPIAMRPMILAQIAKTEGIKVSDIIVEG